MTEDLRLVLRNRLMAAMKERDRVAVRALRSAIAAIENAEAPEVGDAELAGVAIERSPRGAGTREVPRVALTREDMQSIIRSEIEQRLDAADGYERAGQAERVAQLRTEAAVLNDLSASAS